MQKYLQWLTGGLLTGARMWGKREKETGRHHKKKPINTLLGFISHTRNCSLLKPVTSILLRTSGWALSVGFCSGVPRSILSCRMGKKMVCGGMEEEWTDPPQPSSATEEQLLQSKSQQAGAEPWHEQAKTSLRTWASSSFCPSSLAESVQTLAPPCPTHTQFNSKVTSS